MRDESLIERLKSNDENAFREVIDMYQKPVLKIAYGYTNNFHDSDDITQDTFMSLHKNISKIKSLEHLKLFIYKVAVSRSIDFIRKNKFKKLFIRNDNTSKNYIDNIPAPGHNPEKTLSDKSLTPILKVALNSLSAKQKSVFMLKNYEGLTINEIAKITGMGESTVKTHLFRATKSLKKALGGPSQRGEHNE